MLSLYLARAQAGKYKTKDGGSGEWTAKRFNESADVKREDRKIASFAYKTKQVRVLRRRRQCWCVGSHCAGFLARVPRKYVLVLG